MPAKFPRPVTSRCSNSAATGGAARIGLRQNEHRSPLGLDASFFRFGQRDGWAKTNPAKPLSSPRKGRSLPHFLSAEEFGLLFDAPSPDDPMGLRDRAILETMYSAGLRISEAVGLDDSDLDFDAGIVRVRGKGRRERLSPVGSYATAAIARWLKFGN